MGFKDVDELDGKNSNEMRMSAGVKPSIANISYFFMRMRSRNVNYTNINSPFSENEISKLNEVKSLIKKMLLFLTGNNKYALFILYFLALMAIAGNVLFIFYLSQSWQESVVIITSILVGFLLLLFLLNKSEAVIRLLVNMWRLWVEVDAREQIFSELVDNKRDVGWALLSVAILIFLFTELITPHYLVNLLNILVGN